MGESNYQILNRVDSPSDLKKLGLDELVQLSEELRQFIIDEVSENPGHLGASLGVTELTIALHYIYETPKDQIVWDVGHQAYGHKILTGRRDLFHTNRKLGGISGFPKRSESPYDAFQGGHASVSISAALGMATAAKKLQNGKKVVAVIGDGSLTGGVAFEGLNNAGSDNSDILVILNDNNMAIDPNVGALKEYLVDITTSKTYNWIKNLIWHLLGGLTKTIPYSRRFFQNIEQSIKTFFLKKSELFEALNFRYFGPVDGHDIAHLTRLLEDLKDIPGPKLLHCVTQKGKGFKQAELNQTIWHAPGKFDKITGELITIQKKHAEPPKYQDVFGHTLLELARRNEKIIGITPAMPTGSSMNIMMKEMPDRVFDVGIAEQHAVSFSAGLATQGLIPFCNIYSTFMQRAYDQVIHDVAIQNLNVVFCLDRAGLVGEDGATHHGAYDIPYFRCIPNMIIASPMNEGELRNLMFTAQNGSHGPFAIRYPRGQGVMSDWQRPFTELTVGKGRLLKEGDDVAILTIGPVGNDAQKAIISLGADQYRFAHYDMRFVKPLDEELLHTVCCNYRQIITIEDGAVKGGFGSSVLEFINENGYHVPVKMLGIPDQFIEQGSSDQLKELCGYDVDGIMNTLKSYVKFGVLSDAM
ncbi:MAG: 1-deoxy-D-xylulose-5-phosphate synthase [Bacteroidota bacterium]